MKKFKNFLLILNKILKLSFNAPNFLFITLSQFLAGTLYVIGLSLIIPIVDQLLFQKNINLENNYINNLENLFNIEFNFFILSIVTITTVILALIVQSIGLFLAYYSRYSIIMNYRQEIMKSHSNLKWKFVSTKHSGTLNDILLQQLELLGAGYFTLYSLWIAFFQVLTFMIIGILISSEMTIVILLTLFVLFIFSVWLQSIVRKKSQISSSSFQDYSIEVADYSNNLKFYKFLSSKNTDLHNKFIDLTTLIRDSLNKVFQINVFQNLFIQISTIMIVLFLAYNSSIFSVSASELLVFILVIQRLGNYTLSFYSNALLFQSNLPPIDIVENYIEFLDKNQDTNGIKKIDEIRSIEFKKVEFSYDNSVNIFSNIDFLIKDKITVGITGKSGSGKSTLLDLITLLNYPLKGEVLINGIDASEVDKYSYWKRISLINQNSTLIKGTIKENITMGLNFTNSEIISICKQTFIHDWIQSLPDKLNTVVGEKGAKISGGQLQRILIARCLITLPDVLILDEATNALDDENLSSINRLIDNLNGKLLIIIISHNQDNLPKIDKFITT